jgi:hypothetical protein
MESSRISDGNMMIMSGNGVPDSYIIELLKQEFEIVGVDTMPYATLLICNLVPSQIPRLRVGLCYPLSLLLTNQNNVNNFDLF